jgi:magnesium transporter
MNQLEYTGSHKSLSQRCSCLSMMPQIIQNMMILRFDFKSLELKKTNWLNLHGLNEMEIIEA